MVCNMHLSQVGTWTAVLKNPSSEGMEVVLDVTSRPPTAESYPITLTARLSHQRIDFNSQYQQK